MNELKKHWVAIAIVCALGFYVYTKKRQTATAANNPVGGATP